MLVCTTIVETGLDISNANTLIVERAEMLGLSQMHQLRGRVGRGRERGYAYFLYPPEKPLTETAHDRLATIAQNSDLGAGHGGGHEGPGDPRRRQHPRRRAERAHRRRRVRPVRPAGRRGGDRVPPAGRGRGGRGGGDPAEVRVELPVDAHIPHDYVPAERLRLEVYRKIAEAGGPGRAGRRSSSELTDRYGEPPTPVRNLLAVAAFRQTCRALGVTEVAVAGNGIRIAPVELPDSAQLRLRRLHPKATYKAAAKVVVVPRPVDGGRIGGHGAARHRAAGLVRPAAARPAQPVRVSASA